MRWAGAVRWTAPSYISPAVADGARCPASLGALHEWLDAPCVRGAALRGASAHNAWTVIIQEVCWTRLLQALTYSKITRVLKSLLPLTWIAPRLIDAALFGTAEPGTLNPKSADRHSYRVAESTLCQRFSFSYVFKPGEVHAYEGNSISTCAPHLRKCDACLGDCAAILPYSRR